MAADKTRVEIGFLEKCDKEWILESRFFPSKVGGKPAWLDLKNISIDLNCGVCSNPCVFLCQVYAPIDLQDDAYHRTVFVFVCRDPSCCEPNKCDNLKVFRCQLPRSNPFYVPEEPNDEADWHPESKIDRFSDTCEVCGCLGSHRCSKCKSVKYCSKSHQILDWKSGHSETCCTDKKRSKNADILFPEYEIIIETETCDENGLDNGDDSESEEEVTKSDVERFREFQELLRDGKGGTLQGVPCEMLNNFALCEEDKYSNLFRKRLSLFPDQVLRYDKGGEPLWITEPNLKIENVPHCEYCNEPRQFEFQILSTLLNFLDVDSLDKSLDWGNLLIYTCKNNCADEPTYKKEFIWKQDII